MFSLPPQDSPPFYFSFLNLPKAPGSRSPHYSNRSPNPLLSSSPESNFPLKFPRDVHGEQAALPFLLALDGSASPAFSCPPSVGKTLQPPFLLLGAFDAVPAFRPRVDGEVFAFRSLVACKPRVYQHIGASADFFSVNTVSAVFPGLLVGRPFYTRLVPPRLARACLTPSRLLHSHFSSRSSVVLKADFRSLLNFRRSFLNEPRRS